MRSLRFLAPAALGLAAALSLALTTFFASGHATPAHAVDNTYTVDSMLDTSDANPGDFVCDDGAGNCTFRAAIEEVNQNFIDVPLQVDEIKFATPDMTIAPATELPALAADYAFVDGFSGGGRVELDLGTGNGTAPLNNWEIDANGASIFGFDIHGGQYESLFINGNNNVIQSNYIGTDRSGLTAAPSPAATGNGFTIFGDGNIIGGDSAGEGNIISGNAWAGVYTRRREQPAGRELDRARCGRHDAAGQRWTGCLARWPGQHHRRWREPGSRQRHLRQRC